jgi:hypothetical protein
VYNIRQTPSKKLFLFKVENEKKKWRKRLRNSGIKNNIYIGDWMGILDWMAGS